MVKNTVNLIIKEVDEPQSLKRLKIILPVLAGSSLLIFILVFIASIIYINNNIVTYKLLKRNVDQFEKNIVSRKNIEGVYTLTSARLNVLDQLSGKVMDFPPLIDDINKLSGNGISVKSVSSDNKGNISFALTASSSAALDDFVGLLEKKELNKIFYQINANGIVREKKGVYDLSISLKRDFVSKK